MKTEKTNSTNENIKSEVELTMPRNGIGAQTGTPLTTTTTTVNNSKKPGSMLVSSRLKKRSNETECLLTSSPFNTVSPPNKTVSDTYDVSMNLDLDGIRTQDPDEGQFDEALILAAATASEDEITNLVTPLLS